MVAARLLYPGAQLVLVGSQDRNVREFLTLHEELLDVKLARDIDLEAVTRLIVVETQSSRRLGEFAGLLERPEVEVIVWDHHHPPPEDGVRADELHVAETGAATTLLVQELQRRGLTVTPFEATVMLLGIYEDTGSLSFAGTTPEDVEAAAFLLRAGGNLGVVAEFIHRALTPAQRRVLNELLAHTEYVQVNGVPVAIATAGAGPYVSELALLAHKLSDLENVGVVFVLAHMGDAVYVVGRARSDALNVGEAMAGMGGGGHSRAASAVLKNTSLPQARDRLLGVLQKLVRREPLAGEVMSVPARTVLPETSIAEAGRLMVRYGHSGLSVVEDGRLVGIITRRDVDRAGHHRLSHAPVKGFMTRDVVTASLETPVSEIERLMIERDVGRLPVVADGRVVGVVTRTDLLRALHGARYAEGFRPWGTDDVRPLLEGRLPAPVRSLLHVVGEAAAGQEIEAFVVGGFVRDLLLGVESPDLDVLTDRDAIRLAAEVARVLGGRLRGHHQFSTAEVKLPEGTFPEGVKIDFATARSESYEHPGAMPEVEGSSIEQDLRRRDFTINAMAIQINADRFGRLLDPYGGRRDLERRVIRVLHNLSFVEDPTRIFRAVRFEARYEFRMDSHTEALARHAVEDGSLSTVAAERLRKEFYLLFQEPSPARALRRLGELGVLTALRPGLTGDPALLERIESAVGWLQSRVSERLDRQAIYLAGLLSPLGPDEAGSVCRDRLRIPPQKAEIVEASLRSVPRLLPTLAQPDLSSSQVYRTVNDLPLEALAFVRAAANDPLVDERLDLYLSRLRGIGLAVSGSDLIAAGHRPSPRFGAALRQVLDAKLDRQVTGCEEELALALELLGPAPGGEGVRG
jgi:tRNA nucleotidyltransferase (CCA-adding enzyme)